MKKVILKFTLPYYIRKKYRPIGMSFITFFKYSDRKMLELKLYQELRGGKKYLMFSIIFDNLFSPKSVFWKQIILYQFKNCI